MSKIYEALRRAEMDRATVDRRKSPRTEEPGPAATVVMEPFPQPEYLPAPVATPSEVVPVAAPAPAIDSALSLDKIPTQVWRPSFHHLPALELRGRPVEQFRSLRSRMHEFRDLNTLKSILVSSGLPQEGKSFIAANLAISFARHKASRVLLIDGDMRRSSLHHLLGCASEPGLTDYLSGNASALDIMQRAKPGDGNPLHHGLESLTFIGAGRDSDKAADLSGNQRFEQLIATVSPLFDWIVVDSSPVNLVSDGVNLSRACDGVLLVARAGVTKFEVAQRALSELKAANTLGFVLNAVRKVDASGGYYGYDGYGGYGGYGGYDSVEAPSEQPAQ